MFRSRLVDHLHQSYMAPVDGRFGDCRSEGQKDTKIHVDFEVRRGPWFLSSVS